MVSEDVKRISKVFDEKFKLLLGEVARVRSEVTDTKTGQFRQYSEVSKIGKDIARIDSTLETMTEEFAKQTKKFGILWDQVVKVTADLEQVRDDVVDIKKILVSNTEKLDKRVRTVEAHAGISPPPELTI